MMIYITCFSRIFIFPSEFTELQRNINVKGDLYHCLMCSYVTLCSSHFKRHLLMHTDSKPFECPVCQKTFRQKIHLKTHMHTHTGERPYQCQSCGRRFLTKQNCQTHLCRVTKDVKF